ncbi:hypothetical protein ME3_01030 [Bartonella melophagi K-2C]|uniref:Uncharacterized protein n=1 Tax=Bartonella melophagi K-2C TaxID=1094557 RepID=J1JUF2_9HYPH|nr:hypothetical protein ME3_01030 [Bartonella melophagi K-2C]
MKDVVAVLNKSVQAQSQKGHMVIL